VNAGQTATPPVIAGGQPTLRNESPEVLTRISGEIDNIITVEGPGTPTVVIVVEPKEALQEGDRSKLETPHIGTSSPSSTGGGQ
jgi:hypothetical protein